MIPTEVVTIAEVLALEDGALIKDWEDYADVAWRIYTALQKSRE